ncbi:MAG: GNAT family N-acetyltransferase, partial [Sediminibacterium sp.]|jgi:ribosomal protein S18 acetylase RimI-like enzyme
MVLFTIENVNENEVEQLQSISRQTFAETFSDSNSKENMDKYLTENLSIKKLSEELNNENSHFFFIKDGERNIGYLKLNMGPSQTEMKDETALEIERIYVIQEYQGKKVGQQLYEKAIQVAKEKKAQYVWLGVWEENHKAIQFYNKNGFEVFDKHVFVLGDEKQTDLMMRLFI